MAPSFTACTVASPSFHAHAAVLAESFLEHHPAQRMAILDLGAATREARSFPAGAEVIDPNEIVGREELRRMGLAYSPQGLAGAMKPRLIRHLQERDGVAMLLDSDMCVHGDLGDLASRAEREGLLVAPHLIRPLRDAELPTLLAGTYNSGFIAAGPGAAELLDWWCERTHRDCIYRASAGMVWEQTWLSLAPAFFDISVLRDPGVNVMTRELLDRDVEWRGDVPHLADRPLRVMHYSGPYDPHRPDRLLSQASSGDGVVLAPGPGMLGELAWLDLARRPGAARLSRSYAERLLAAGFDEARGREAPFARLPGGTAIHIAMRSAYRSALIEAEHDGTDLPPNPFLGDDEDRFLAWLAAPPPPGDGIEGDPGLSRFLRALRVSFGGEAIFPLSGDGGSSFAEWASRHLAHGPEEVPAMLLPAVPKEPAAGSPRRRWTPRAR